MDRKGSPGVHDFPHIDVVVRAYQLHPLPESFKGQGAVFMKMSRADVLDDQERDLGFVGGTHDGGCDIFIRVADVVDGFVEFHLSPDDLWAAFTQAIGYRGPGEGEECGHLEGTYVLQGGTWAPPPSLSDPIYICCVCGEKVEINGRIIHCRDCSKPLHDDCVAWAFYEASNPHMFFKCPACHAKHTEPQPIENLAAPNFSAPLVYARTDTDMQTMPKSLVRFWPQGAATRKRKVTGRIKQWIGMAHHYHVSINIEPNPFWNPATWKWEAPWNDPGGQIRAEDGVFNSYRTARQYLLDTVKIYCQPADQFEVEVEEGTYSEGAQQWFYREGD